MAIKSILKSHIFPKQNPLEHRLLQRFTHLPVILLAHHFHSLSSPLPVRRRFVLSSPPRSSTLLRRRLPRLFTPMSTLNSSQDADASPSSPATKTERVVIKGRVQGVFYRNWTIENAKELGLKGWVRNRRDGSVEALFSGSPEKVEEMEQRCRSGPPLAMVTGLQVFPSTDDPGTGFERKPTI